MVYRIYFTVLITEIILCIIKRACDLDNDSTLFHIISVVAFILFIASIGYLYWFIWTVGR